MRAIRWLLALFGYRLIRYRPRRRIVHVPVGACIQVEAE